MTDDTTLRIERLIDAPPDVVFRAWTTTEAMEEWYRDGGDVDVARVVELDLRVGGRLPDRVRPRRASRRTSRRGEYLEIDPPHRLVMSETLEGVEGAVVEYEGDRRVRGGGRQDPARARA